MQAQKLEPTFIQRMLRVLKHRWVDERASRKALDEAALERITQRVAASEQRHTGEIRICVEGSLPIAYAWRAASTAQVVRERAVTMFGKLRVWDTADNNGVLIYVMLAEHAIEVVADRGLNAHVGAAEWQAVIQRMSAHFRQDQFEDGLTQALAEISALLVRLHPQPATSEDSSTVNQLPDRPDLR
jgi:uncharacterized membrane protein